MQLQDSVYTEKISKCPLCDSGRLLYQYTIKKFKISFTIERCYSCNFMFMNPPFTDEVIQSFYTENYYKGNTDYSYHDEREISQFSEYVWDKRVDHIHTFIESGNFLDIGASFGGLLNAAKKYYEPYGIELSSYSGNYARSRFGDSVHIGTIENHPFENSFFSCITMIELLEHLREPKSALQECYNLLQHDGVLVVQTANMNGLQAQLQKDRYAYFMPGHLSYFSKDNLAKCLKDIGFSKIRFYFPVEFGLLPKLQKSRHSFKKISDYRAWLKISAYHLISKIHFNNFNMTSSMVLYAFK